ncbi:hypothetical protein EUX98_g5505 [Antrodiella citrinella]|uniref:DUF6532 domain-containing protein n=1 Tax=Antrodiella citrinella TaxID=2447956 RepID=A0A4S4MR98_9APHY|nr:hypothetical protein EUX98_g5505 [Antrodiella citrinella]
MPSKVKTAKTKKAPALTKQERKVRQDAADAELIAAADGPRRAKQSALAKKVQKVWLDDASSTRRKHAPSVGDEDSQLPASKRSKTQAEDLNVVKESKDDRGSKSKARAPVKNGRVPAPKRRPVLRDESDEDDEEMSGSDQQDPVPVKSKPSIKPAIAMDEDDSEEEEEVDQLDSDACRTASEGEEEEEDDDDEEEEVDTKARVSNTLTQEMPVWNELREDTPLPEVFADGDYYDAPTPPPRKKAVKPIINTTPIPAPKPAQVVKARAKALPTTSRREAKRKLEAPIISDDECTTLSDPLEQDPPGINTGNNGKNIGPVTYPVWTDLVFNNRGTTNLTPQHPSIRHIIKDAISQVEQDCAFVTPFPEIQNKNGYLGGTIVHAAKARKAHQKLLERILNDPGYLHAMISHPSNRVSHCRGDLKEIVASRLPLMFDFIPVLSGIARPPDVVKPMVANLLQGRKFIYPLQRSENIDVNTLQLRPFKTQPYQAPLIIQVLHGAYFGTKGAGTLHAHLLKSSIADKPTELELPVSMLAMVVTTIHACLISWKTGTYITSAFNVDAGAKHYTETLGKLNDTLKEAGPAKAHRMLTNLLTSTLDCTPFGNPSAALDDDEEVDFANMPE